MLFIKLQMLCNLGHFYVRYDSSKAYAKRLNTLSINGLSVRKITQTFECCPAADSFMKCTDDVSGEMYLGLAFRSFHRF